MNHWEIMEPIIGTLEATSDFADWLKELKKSSIVEIDIIGLHDKTTGENREFVAIDKVLEIIDEIEHDTGHVALIGVDNKFAGVLCNSSEFRDRVLALKGEAE